MATCSDAAWNSWSQDNDPASLDNGSWTATNTQSKRPSRFAHTMWVVIGLAGAYGPEPTGALAGSSGGRYYCAQDDAQLSRTVKLAACASCSGGSTGDAKEGTTAAAAELPRAEFDPAALAAQLGKDPRAHFEWVRDHTWWAPYRGLLRGSQDVMLDR